VNRDVMEAGIRQFLEGLFDGLDEPAAKEWIEQTPGRVARAFEEDLAAGYGEDPSSFLEPIPVEDASGAVILEGIRFTSLCAHHLLPFRGEVTVGFVPDRSHVGLGGIARLVDSLSRRLCLQESLTAEIADHLQRALHPKAVVVVVEAEHLCLAARGARKIGHRFRTIERRGTSHPELDHLR